MKVGELIKELSRFDPELEVVCYTEDEDFLAPGYLFRILEIDSVDEGKGERRRNADGRPTLAFGHSKHSERFVFINVTGDF